MKKVLGIGNALVDIIYFLDNTSLLNTFSLPVGSMQLVDAEKALLVEKAASGLKNHMASGGSAANTIHGLASLGVQTAFIGTVGKDDIGNFFEKDMTENGIDPFLSLGTVGSGRAISLVSPDGERTFATYLGAAVEIPADRIIEPVFSRFEHLHVEGYLVPNRILIESVFKLARKCGMTVSLDMASYNVVEANLTFLKQLLKEYNPIVFANEEEARAFSGFTDPHQALEYFTSFCETVIVKIGSKGSLIADRAKKYAADAIHVKCIDTTGAGDLYAAGFLYGYINGYAPDRCGRIGSLLAGKVIEGAGAKINPDAWSVIRKRIQEV